MGGRSDHDPAQARKSRLNKRLVSGSTQANTSVWVWVSFPIIIAIIANGEEGSGLDQSGKKTGLNFRRPDHHHPDASRSCPRHRHCRLVADNNRLRHQ